MKDYVKQTLMVLVATLLCMMTALILSGCGNSEAATSIKRQADPTPEVTEDVGQADPTPDAAPITIADVPRDIRSLVSELQIPDHSLKATPVKMSVSDSIDPSARVCQDEGELMVVYRSDEDLDTSTAMSRDDIIALGKQWLRDNIVGVSWDDFSGADPEYFALAQSVVLPEGNDDEMILSGNIRLQTMIDGIPVFMDQCIFWTDGQGIARCSINHSDYEFVDEGRQPLDRDALCVSIEQALRAREAQFPFYNRGDIKEYSIMYQYDSNNANVQLDPILTISFTDSYPVIVNLATGVAYPEY